MPHTRRYHENTRTRKTTKSEEVSVGFFLQRENFFRCSVEVLIIVFIDGVFHVVWYDILKVVVSLQ
jgi:hypothetical protein